MHCALLSLTIIRLLDSGRDPEVLLHKELWANLEAGQFWDGGGGVKSASEDIFLGVIRDQMLGNAVDDDRHCLLDQAVFLEAVRIGEGTDKGTLLVLLEGRLDITP